MSLLTTRPGAHASVRNIRVSAFKARPVLRLIQGRSYEEAVETLKFCDRGAADVIAKCLSSAAANAEHNEGIDPEETFVSACFADEGPTMRRWRPRARGRATRINKRTCHITIQLVRYTPEELAERAARESSSSSASAEARRRRVAASRGEDEAEASEDEVLEDADGLETSEEEDSSEDAGDASSESEEDDAEAADDEETDDKGTEEADDAADDAEEASPSDETSKSKDS